MNRRPVGVSRWDIAAIGSLGVVGFALSYDALQQMAEAIHIRGQLTYAFPVVVDGFVAYGTRALVLLREAQWTARAYTWTLFFGATGTSVWANALHAVRLNEQNIGQASGLHLGDVAVGALSTIAPLALAGAVHLGIIVTRHGGEQADPASDAAQPSLTIPATVTFGRPAGADDAPNLEPPIPTRSEAITRNARAELTDGTDRTPSRSAEEKLAAHRRGSRLRDRITSRILRRTQHPPVRP
ncbi:DUF2637 domain-containing protein, partial [Kitasatospora sp. Root187]|uniref:DUF2637 domain-containing protein n=2 Tax=unclassified Kitasatospora TaxID=2633591 RepID=UPI0009E8F1D5